jgi:hypothetical protein
VAVGLVRGRVQWAAWGLLVTRRHAERAALVQGGVMATLGAAFVSKAMGTSIMYSGNMPQSAIGINCGLRLARQHLRKPFARLSVGHALQ